MAKQTLQGDLLSAAPVGQRDELVELLYRHGATRIERIVSRGHSSSPGFWYDQPHDEWVAVLMGEGRVGYQDGTERSLRPGQWLLIPSHTKHRVAGTDPDHDTIWLAVHLPPGKQ